jgi:hypothetical protein
MDVDVSIYLATRTRWAHLEKSVSLPAVPRVGEFVKVRNAEMGDYFAFEVASVTYREGGGAEVMTELLDNVDGRMYSFDEEQELDEYVTSFVNEGWRCDRGIVANRRIGGPDPIQDGG